MEAARNQPPSFEYISARDRPIGRDTAGDQHAPVGSRMTRRYAVASPGSCRRQVNGARCP